MNRRSQNHSPQSREPSVPRIIGDCGRLMELQVQLIKVDIRDCARRVLISGCCLALAASLGLASTSILLASIALWLTGLGLTQELALLSTGCGGLIVGALITAGVWLRLRNRPALFSRSNAELRTNLDWLKQVVGIGEHQDENDSEGSGFRAAKRRTVRK